MTAVRWNDSCNGWLERQKVRGADLVLAATDEYAARLRHTYPQKPAQAIDVLYNGYDPADYPVLESDGHRPHRPLRITYAGSLYGGRDPFPLLQGLARLVNAKEV